MIQLFPDTLPPQNTPIVDSKGNLTTPGMSFLRTLFNRTGQGNGLVDQVGTITANGTLQDDWNLVTGGSAVTLPALVGGQSVVVFNQSGGSVTVNAPAGATIDGSASYTLTWGLGGKMQIFWFFSQTQIFSTQLG